MVLSRDEPFSPSCTTSMEEDSPTKLPHVSHLNYSSNSSELSSNRSSPSPTFHKPITHLIQQQHAIYRRESLPSISYITQPLKNHDINNRRHSIASREISASSSTCITKTSLLLHNTNNNALQHQLNSGGVYTRSPELKISHKLAERKRRKEMKNLFDDLRDVLLIDKNVKVSKWEVLSKAVKHIEQLKKREVQHLLEKEQLKKELNELKACASSSTASNDSSSHAFSQ